MPILANVSGLGDKPHVKDLIGTVKVMLDAYRDGELDRLFLVNAQFVNTMTQKPTVEQLLPIEALDTEGLQEHWDYIYEPDAAAILDGLLMRYIESQVYRGAVENVASEMAARMVAMKCRLRQRRQAHQRIATDLQQGPPGRDHEGNLRDRGRRRCRLEERKPWPSRRGTDYPDHRRRHRRRVSA